MSLTDESEAVNVDIESPRTIRVKATRPVRQRKKGRRIWPADREAPMTITDRIEVNPRVMLGKPVIRGTRIPAELILRKLSEGSSEASLLDAYPRITREDIDAAMRYAADTVTHEEIVFLDTARPA
jgi:uncharacterized protein (DUF433 family)